jgi:hypothetical protein
MTPDDTNLSRFIAHDPLPLSEENLAKLVSAGYLTPTEMVIQGFYDDGADSGPDALPIKVGDHRSFSITYGGRYPLRDEKGGWHPIWALRTLFRRRKTKRLDCVVAKVEQREDPSPFTIDGEPVPMNIIHLHIVSPPEAKP